MKTLVNKMHINNLKQSQVDNRVAAKVKATCFSHFLEIPKEKIMKQSMRKATALFSFYKEELD